MVCELMYVILECFVVVVRYCDVMNALNGERFAGLNFCVFHSFQEYHESFSVSISASL